MQKIWRTSCAAARLFLCNRCSSGSLVSNPMTVTRKSIVQFVLRLFRRFIVCLRRTFKPLNRAMGESFVVVFKAGGYAVYVLFLLLGAYLLNQLDRYALAVSSQPMAHDIKFGDKGCLPYNSSFSKDYKKICVESVKDSNEPEKNQTA